MFLSILRMWSLIYLFFFADNQPYLKIKKKEKWERDHVN